MCLSLKIRVPATARVLLEDAVHRVPRDGLRVEVIHAAPWPWAHHRDAEALVSEKGGCACSLLAENADWDAEVWAMRSDVLEPLARTLSSLAEAGPEGMVVEALWQGEKSEREERVTPRELAALALRSGLGTHTRYLVSRQSG